MVKSTIPAGVFRSNGLASSLSAFIRKDGMDREIKLLMRVAFLVVAACLK